MRQNHTTLPVTPRGTFKTRWEYRQLSDDSPQQFQQRQKERIAHQIELGQRVVKC